MTETIIHARGFPEVALLHPFCKHIRRAKKWGDFFVVYDEAPVPPIESAPLDIQPPADDDFSCLL